MHCGVGELGEARGEADSLLDDALSTADPSLQARAWKVKRKAGHRGKELGRRGEKRPERTCRCYEI